MVTEYAAQLEGMDSPVTKCERAYNRPSAARQVLASSVCPQWT